ncbi:hypothetical protein Tco_0743143 [Tanacetum coccineum]
MIKNSKRGNRKIRIPIAMWPCRVEEKMTLKEVDGQTVEEIETKIIDKDDTITRVLEKFQGYETSEEEPVEQPRRHDMYGFVDHLQPQQGNPMNEFAPHRLPQPKGNMNGWLIEDEEEVDRNEVDSDLQAPKVVNLRSPLGGEYNVRGGIYNYVLATLIYICATTIGGLASMNYIGLLLIALHDGMARIRCQSGNNDNNNNENLDIAAIIAQQLQTILP